MKDTFDLHKYYSNAINQLDKLEQDHVLPSHFYESYFIGDNQVYQKQETDRKKFDDTWLKTIEAYFPSLDKITRNMKSQLKYESEILPIEKIKRVGPDSIKHLSSHTNLISEIDEDDNVIPYRLLADLSEIDYGIYENRFIMTLVFRLRDYILDRIKIVSEGLYANRTTRLNVSNAFNFHQSDIEIQINVVSKERFVQRKEDEHNLSVLERAERLYKLISNLTNSTFIKTMKHYKKVTPPIIKTQIILKNTDFKNAYLLWMYLDKTFNLDFTYEQESRQKRFNNDYRDNLNKMSLMLFSTLFYHNESESAGSYQRAKYKKINSKVVTELSDEYSLDPKSHIIENQQMNEYFLKEITKVFKKEIASSDDKDQQSKIYIKTALEDMIKISNRVTESYFKVNADDDIFNRLVEINDRSKALDKTYDKQKITRIMREVKERDYKKALELEKKWFKELTIKQKALIDEKQQTSDKKLLDQIEKESKKYDVNIKKSISKAQKKHTDFITKERKELAALKAKLEKDLQKEKKRIIEEKKLRLEKERQKLKLKKEKEKEKLLKQAARKKETESNKIKKEKEKLVKLFQKQTITKTK
ncbi:MAG TPA: hypothetical protein VJY66_02295 [Acholeplasma sp.]|nr:hypothetical protein [Acholeplasma sp.]